MRIFLLVLVVAGLAGCAAPGSRHQANLHTWVGQSADDVIARWGMPTTDRKLDSGKRIIEYIKNGRAVAQANYNPYIGATSSAYQQQCRTTFLVNEMDMVEGFSWEGYCGR